MKESYEWIRRERRDTPDRRGRGCVRRRQREIGLRALAAACSVSPLRRALLLVSSRTLLTACDSSSVIEAYGSFAPIPIQVPQPAPPPPDYPLPALPQPLPAVPKNETAVGYGPPCGAGKIPGDGNPGEFNCIWATYTPLLRGWAPTHQFNHSVKGFIEPTLVRGEGIYAGHLLVQSGSVIYSSTDEGEKFVPLCEMPPRTAEEKTGFVNGLGLLS